MQGVPGELYVEGLTVPLRLSHKFFSLVRHTKDVHRIGILVLEGIFIAGVTVRLVVTVLFGTAA